ncbi:MAG: hypothetical protein JSW25_04185, partial [Thermoplasmata archaeon]
MRWRYSGTPFRTLAGTVATVLVVLLLGLSAYVPPSDPPDDAALPTTDADLTVTEIYRISGIASFDQILVASTGTLVIPSGSILTGTSLMMAGDSRLEMTGGTLLVRGIAGTGPTQLSGLCRHVDISQGSAVHVWGTNGTASAEGSMGTSAILSLRATDYIRIEDSTVEVMGGHGHSPQGPFGDGPLSGKVCSGGDADLALDVVDNLGK